MQMQVVIMSKHQNILVQDCRNVELGEYQESDMKPQNTVTKRSQFLVKERFFPNRTCGLAIYSFSELWQYSLVLHTAHVAT